MRSSRIALRSRGFTLVEVLVAFVLLASFLFLVYQALQLGMRFSDRTTRISRDDETIFLTRRFVSDKLTLSQPFTETSNGREIVSFLGSSSQLRFVTVAQTGVFRKLVWLELRTRNGAFEIAQWDYLPRQSVRDPVPLNATIDQVPAGTTELRLRYQGPENLARWRSDWRDKTYLPAAVTVSVITADLKWPDLVAAPDIGITEVDIERR